MTKNKLINMLVLSVLVLAVFSACTRTKNEDQGYLIYFTSQSSDKLISKRYEVKSQSTLDMVRELFNKMKRFDYDDVYGIIPENVTLNAYYIENNVLYMDFSTGFYDMKNITRAIFCAGIVKTMVQVPAVEYVYFYVNGQPVSDSDGIDIGPLNGQSFIIDDEDDTDTVERLVTTLYFSDSSGGMLVGENTEIIYNKNTSIERLIVEYLIDGPRSDDNKRTLPSKLKVLGISTKDGICYVNFDSAILSSFADVSARVTIYSVVNSLCELPSVKRVQFLVNGGTNYTFRETFSFKDTYERNLDLIKKEE